MISLARTPVEHRLARATRQAVDGEAEVLDGRTAGASHRLLQVPARRRFPANSSSFRLKGILHEARRAHRLLGPRPHRARTSSRSSRRPSASATTRSGPPRPTAPTPRRSSAGSPGRRAKIKIGSAIFQMPGRSPAMTAMTAATLDQLSDGRMLLGIGSSGPQVAEGWHGVRFAKQLQRTREYIEVVRMALARERVEYHGETIELPLPDGPGKALKLTIAPVQERDPDLPRGDRAEEHGAGRRDRRRLDPDALLARAPARAARVARGGRRAGRPLARRASTSRRRSTSTSPTTSSGAATSMRPFIALYVGGMGSREKNFYNELVRRYGFEDAAARGPGPLPRGQAGRGDGGAARRADRPGLARSARRDVVRERLRVYRDAGVGTLGVTPMASTQGGARSSSCG